MVTAVAHFGPHTRGAAPPLAAAGSHDRFGSVLLGVLLFVNEAVFRVADSGEFSFHWQIPLRLGVCALCGMYGLIHLNDAFPALLRGRGVLVTLFGIWILIIVPFASSPNHSLAACVTFWCATLFVAALTNRLDHRAILRSILISLSVFLFGSWIAYAWFAPLGREVQILPEGLGTIVRFGGLSHPNGLGRQAALTVAMFLVAGTYKVVRWRIVVPMIAAAILTAFMTNSRTSLLIIFAVFVTYFGLRMASWRNLFVLSVISVFAASLVAAGSLTGVIGIDPDNALGSIARNGKAEEIYSMTGRTDVWVFTWDWIMKSPWTGYGFGCARFVMQHNFFSTHHAHNQLLNVILTTGFIGGALLVVQFVSLALNAIGTRNLFIGLFLTVILVGGMADCLMLGPIPDSNTVIWLLALLCPMDQLAPDNSRTAFTAELV